MSVAVTDNVFERSAIRGIIVGRQLNALLSKLETGPWYQFKVYYNEVDVHQLKNDKNQIRGEKRVSEESLVQEKAKRLGIDEKAREALEIAEKKGAVYKWSKR